MMLVKFFVEFTCFSKETQSVLQQAKMMTPVGQTNQYVNKIFTKHKTFEISLLKKSDLAVSKLRLFID